MGIVIAMLLWGYIDLYRITMMPYKDGGFLGAYLIAVGCCLNPPKSRRMRILAGIVVALFLFYGTALRYNALFAAIPLFVWLMAITIPSKKLKIVIPAGLTLWLAMVLSIHYVNNNVIQAVRLYPLSEMFYSDIWHLNARTSRYIPAPDTFGNEFNFTEEEFREKFDSSKLFLRRAFREITDSLPPEKQMLMDRSTFVIYPSDKDAHDALITALMLEVRYPSDFARLNLVSIEQTQSYPQDYRTLRDAWIKRVTMDLPAYCKFKTQMFYRFCKYSRLWFFGGTNALVLLPVLLFMAVVLTLSGHLLPSSKHFPCAVLVCSALLYIAPLWACLPSPMLRYLYWFFAASFIAIVHFCSQSKLFHEIIQTIHRYLEKKAYGTSES